MRLEVVVPQVVVPDNSVAGLAAPRRAAAAHGKHEEETGQPGQNWPDWYAQHMADESAGQTGSA